MESLIIKFTNKYLYFYSLFKIRGLETKDNHLTPLALVYKIFVL